MDHPVEDGPVAAGFRRLFEPLTIGGLTLRNRMVNTTHGSALEEERDLRYLEERARGGVALMGLHGSNGVFSYTLGPSRESATPEWDQRPISPVTRKGIAHYDDVAIPAMRKRSDVVHAEGAACFGQVYHLGVAPHAQRIHPPIGPSAVPDPYDALVPHPLSVEEIEELILVFAHGIRRVREAGMDAAEIHGAHGYLVNEFLSPYFNRRTDEWGGERDNRLRFVRAILREARSLVGDDFPIGIRLGVDGDGEGRGITVDELVEIGRLLSDDVAYISVSGGSYSGFGDGYELAYVSPWYREPGFNAPTAAALRSVIDVPVIVTGRITDPAIAEGLLADGSADMVGMVRALIADPQLPNKARQGRVQEIRGCLGLSECHYIGPHRTPVTCAVNAGAGREQEMEIVPTPTPGVIVVVGAGPAGMEAARVSALRGHTVYLCDTERFIGGTIRVLARDPNRRNLLDHATYFERELKTLGVNLMLGTTVTADEIAEFAPDAVIVATGGSPMVPQVPGIGSTNAVSALDVLKGRVEVRPRALVIGGLDGHIGAPTIAEYLADQGKETEYASERVDFAAGAEDGTRLALLHRLMSKGVTISTCHKLTAVTDDGASLVQTFTGEERQVRDTTVVLACGLIPNDQLARDLEGRVGRVHLVGDALAPRRLMHATLEGARAALLV